MSKNQRKLKCKKLLYTGTVVRGVWQKGLKVEECGKPNVVNDLVLAYLRGYPMCAEHRGEFLEAMTGRNPYRDDPKQWRAGDIVEIKGKQYRVMAQRKPKRGDLMAWRPHDAGQVEAIVFEPGLFWHVRRTTKGQKVHLVESGPKTAILKEVV